MIQRRSCSFVIKQPSGYKVRIDFSVVDLSVQLWTASWKPREAAAMKQSRILSEIPSIPAAYGLRPTLHLPCHPSFYLILHQTTSPPPASNLFLLRKAESMKVITTRRTAFRSNSKVTQHLHSPLGCLCRTTDTQTLPPLSRLPGWSRDVGGKAAKKGGWWLRMAGWVLPILIILDQILWSVDSSCHWCLCKLPLALDSPHRCRNVKRWDEGLKLYKLIVN